MGQTISDALTGTHLIDGRDAAGGEARFTAVSPRTGAAGAVAVAEATPADVAAAVAVAARTFAAWSRTPHRERGRLLRAIAHALTARRSSIVDTADEETGLGAARLNGELDRTTGQLTLFADLLEEGSYVDATISPGDPLAQPLPRPDVRRLLVPLGPVVVITPSNFPLAFGALGGDTASALAAGCPVIVKGHPSHPGTSERCARAWLAAVRATGAPTGTLALLQARGIETPSALARAPEVAAIGFTGSFAAGRALSDLAAARPRPIPVYAEMGSLNPLFVGEAALAARGAAIAEGLAASITQGTGQFCTKPGLVVVPDTDAGAAFARQLAERVAARDEGLLLNPGILTHLRAQVAETMTRRGVEILTPAPASASASAPASAAQATDVSTKGVIGPLATAGIIASVGLDDFLATPALAEEHFGPFALVIRCPPARMPALAERLEGTLTATLHADAEDAVWASALCDTLADKAGRIVWNGYPTGVAVVGAMHHGGPYPASSSALHTSVGTAAIRRFLRPVAYQNVPDARLPEALRNANPDGLQRNVDGRWTRDPIGA